MKAFFKRSSSRNLLREQSAARNESMENEDPQEQEHGGYARQFSADGRGIAITVVRSSFDCIP